MSRISEHSALISWESAVEWLRSQPEHAQLVSECYYDDPLHFACERYWRSEEWQEVARFIPQRPGVALDMGAGRGIASYALARDGFDVTALEPNPSGLVGAGAIRELSTQNNLRIRVVEERSEKLGFTNREFDLVFARAVLHHTNDLNTACREVFRVLKPGGLFIAVREHVISQPEDLTRFLDNHPLHRLYGGEHAFLLEDYINAICDAGLTMNKVFSPWATAINYFPRTLATLKDEVLDTVVGRNNSIGKILRASLDFPGIWPIARRALELVDRRPGRLYSFIAQKP